MTEKSLAVAGPLDLDGTKRAMAAFDKFKAEVLTDQDFWVGRDRQGVEMKHIKRSGLMKFLMAINGNAAVIDERSEVIKFENKEILVFHFTARATAPNGRFTEAVGSASSDERKFDKPVHDLRALAQTRAVNRAIANLVGGGVVSAEEVQLDEPPRRVENTASVQPPKYQKPSQADEAQGNAASFIADTLQEAGLDPDGVEVASRDWGLFEVKPIVKMDSATWNKYHEALKPLNVVYHSKVKKKLDDPDDPYAGSWTVKVEAEG
jgi:hypothetical protein